MKIRTMLQVCALIPIALAALTAAEQRGVVRFSGLPVPGASVTATLGERTVAVVTGPDGSYEFTDLAEGEYKFKIEMPGFTVMEAKVNVPGTSTGQEWALDMLPLSAMTTEGQPVSTPTVVPAPAPDPPQRGRRPPGTPTTTQAPFQSTDLNAAGGLPTAGVAQSAGRGAFENADPVELSRRAADGFLVNGSTNNGASSPFGQAPSFGNQRRGPGSQYNVNLGMTLGNAVLDARPYSLTGQSAPKPGYGRTQAMLAFGGPLKIPHLLRRNGPNLTVNYQWLRSSTVTAQSGLVPTAAERVGDLSLSPNAFFDPSGGAPFPGQRIPLSRISPQAVSLLALYPVPSFGTTGRYNYQVPIAVETHEDDLQTRFQQRLGQRNQLFGNYSYSNTRTDNPGLTGFLDKTKNTGMNAAVNWAHSFSPSFRVVVGVQYSRLDSRVEPFFASRRNVSGEAGIAGNDQSPENWGPPTLTFSNGLASLTDAQSSLTRNRTTGLSAEFGRYRARHSLAFGGLWRRQQFNLLSQENPRGMFAFTGAATQGRENGSAIPGTGSDLAGFLLGIPDTIAIARGNADKYFRAPTAAGFFTDDWRLNPGLSLSLGARWEYSGPVTELYGRLVNLDITPGFTAAAPILAKAPMGPLTGQTLPPSLIRPDWNNFAPRLGFAWRPLSASSTIVRGGYGLYFDTSIYQAMATQMAQQPPLSTSLQIANRVDDPLSLANAFSTAATSARNTYAIDPDLRTGYAQNWNLSVQKDLPGSLVLIVGYQGAKGTRAQQQILPNTLPTGAADPCAGCPRGFTYLASNGNSIRHAGSVDLRRRLRSGFTASMQYTFAKSIDNASLGGRNQSGALIAQNWLDLRAERALSSFDQRHVLSGLMQYTTGMGLRGGALAAGRRAMLLKDWTFSTQLTAGTGLPLTPVYFAAVSGTGITGSIRPDYTGAPLYDAPPGLALNPSAYSAPAAGHWGNAGRNTITGPPQFTLNAAMNRTFPFGDRWSLDVRLDAFNALNHPVFPSWITTVTSSQFGLANAAEPMRTMQTVVRLRF
ncbi:carboxypeptidase-like regulatory domain-containing protein [uncultured Paludibaculum sp.]|uniref:TonB-dependent receptor n=1 Tax=uncultured Paludibaculum sp. TaxID=1765020 RepID=UPI002AAA85C6|nr:carboxypeptidase-like regulatory domain-containing protein [uncultured Paludibaculum sp.]